MKKAQAGIISLVLILLIAIISITIVWNVVRGIVKPLKEVEIKINNSELEITSQAKESCISDFQCSDWSDCETTYDLSSISGPFVL